MDNIHHYFRWTTKRIILLVFLLLATQVGIAFGVNKILKKAPYLPNVNSVVKAMSDNCSESNAASLIKPNVVRIENKTANGTSYGSGFFEKNGYLVTNSHVIDTKGTITVYFSNGSSAIADIYSNDHNKDLALLSVKVDGVNALEWGDTANLTVPQDLLAFGYALNLPGDVSVTKGVFSARRFYNNISFIQTDTPINVGNSGGPLVNICGEVVGINTVAIDNATVNMAITSESAQSMINELIINKKVDYSDGTVPDTVLSKQFKTVGGPLSKLTNGTPVTNNNSGSLNNQTTANQTTASQSASSQSAGGVETEKKDGLPICEEIGATATTIEVDQSTELTFFYSGSEGNVTWSGDGVFGSDEDANPYISKVSWQNHAAGEYNLTAKVNNEEGNCEKTLKIIVITPPPPVCSEISADSKSLEIDQNTILNFSYSGHESNITWSGDGSFGADDDPSVYSSSLKWSNSIAGTFTLSASAKNDYGECQKNIIIVVLAPPTRIEGLSSMRIGAQPLYNPQTGEQSIGIRYYFAGSSNNPIGTISNRADYLPVSIDVTCKFGGSLRNTVFFQHTYSWEEIKELGKYFFVIWEHEMNFSSDDIVNPGPNGYIPIEVKITGHTPEQGDYNYTDSITFYKMATR